MDTPNAVRIQQLGRENTVVRAALDLARFNHTSYSEALEIAVIELAAQNAKMLEALTQAAIRQPPPVLNRCQRGDR